MSLSQAEQHKKNTLLILARRNKTNIPKQTQKDEITPEEKEQKDVIQATADDLMKLKKSELQEVCLTREIAFMDEDTKAELTSLILIHQEK